MKTPKFALGDIVVNTLYGTVGMVTDIQHVDDMFLYEVNHSQSLFMEQSLVLLSEFSGDVLIAEEIEIELPFFLGELVHVHNYDHDLFKIIGVRTEIYRYQEESWEEIVYELKRLEDGLEIEANIEDVISIASSEETSVTVLQDITLLGYLGEHQLLSSYLPLPERPTEDGSIDQLLDAYNDYQRLYEWFGDEQYKSMMEMTVTRLQKLVQKKDLPS
ncbi:hypothetical protein GFC29_1040 [Anoxybacillus sp. B7M1]|jgi:hypothetical protein|uniref:PRC-barrel domain-containing protein n=1 Tax=Anoxybacteroides rupiense TaxID=311460 RepID=A0ABD5IU06_9BACL|nr:MULTISPECIES: hypothetical protein [Anoxybacillus]ANB58490.1 hypothetical protein GFC28_584 [Anoxybacillus sp. B2M1]ANB64038.1 hypothetical protein GFC29_1040 [Anoxybacillus sp. B7M1]MBB3907992.1 hypothetical protein [Anoxybacillus rupiensis]MBS2771797.1 hypothetical protein [Anoxybacillus rupiensis]MDE8563837.1 hypothetical protein [Anoxybacillus rupiensis]